MKTCLITGCHGFIGSWLARYLTGEGLDVFGTVHRPVAQSKDYRPVTCDFLDGDRVAAVIEETRPDYIFHLAGQTSLALSWQDPGLTFRVNVLGTVALLEAVRTSGLDPIVLVAGSSAEYGTSASDGRPVRETAPCHPLNPYGVSKLAADELACLYARQYGLRIIRVRPFYVIGPGKVPSAFVDFVCGILEVAAGHRERLSVGNLDAVRDAVDIQDTVRALWLVARKGIPGEVYNISTGHGTSIKTILDTMIAVSGVSVPVTTDPTLLRPSDEPILIGDNSRLKALGWRPCVGLEGSLRAVYDSASQT